MIVPVVYTAIQLQQSDKTVAELIMDKIQERIPAGCNITMKPKYTLINLYRCTSCDPVFRIGFINHPEIAQMINMKTGSIAYADIAFIINLPDHILW